MTNPTLKQLSLIDSPANEGFDRFTRLATKILGVPVSLVSIVEPEKDRQFFTSACGLGEPWASRRQTPLSHSFCQHVVSSSEILCVEDARRHPLVQDNLAIRDLGVIAYLGIPVFGPDHLALGALCAIDEKPRKWSQDDIAVLSDLAAAVTDKIGLNAALFQSEQASENNAYLGDIVDKSKNEVFTFDPVSLRFSSVNKGARDNLGYSLEEILKLTPLDIKPEFTEAQFEDLIAPLKRGEIPMLEFETLHRRRDGSTYEVSIRLEHHSGPDRQVLIAFCEDVTERNKLEASLRENTENFSALFNNAPEPISISALDTTLVLANPAYETLHESAPGGMVGKRFVENVPKPRRAAFLAEIAAATPEKPFVKDLEAWEMKGDPRIFMWTNFVQFRGREATKIFSIANDVTELEEARRLAEKSASEAKKAFEIRKAFLANMSHEVRTPLNAIMGLFQLIEMADVPERQKKQAQVGLEASHHLLGQLVNVLELSRMEADAVELAPERTDLRALAEQWKETAIATNHRLSKPIEVSLAIDDRVPDHWTMDARRVTQIVNNLADNALKFTKEGRMRISLGVASGAPELLEISVSDTGCGVPKEKQKSIFERFVQIDDAQTRENGGSGLGLAICRELGGLMGAEVTVESPSVDDCFATEFKLRLNGGDHWSVGNVAKEENPAG